MAPKVERVVDSVELGEGPHWDDSTKSLYFVSIFERTIHKYVPATKKHTKATVGTKTVSFVIPVDGAKDKFLIGHEQELAVVTWDGTSDKVSNIETITVVEKDTKNRLNDAKADPSGRLWAGTMGPEPITGQIEPNKGGLYSFDGRKVKKHLGDISISNGLAWNADLKKFYYIDSPEGKVFQFDFDVTKGTISNKQTVFTFEKHDIPGFPDGQTIDTDGNLWVAVFNGYRVIKINPNKPETLLDTIEIPAKQVTSVAFGGPNLDELYVTSARRTIDGVVLTPPDHGATFKVTGINARGFAGVPVKL